MAVVKSFSQEMVDTLSGVVDFYYWKGIPVAREWPRRTTLPPSAAVLASRFAFSQSRADLRAVLLSARIAWAEYSVGKRQAWLDYYTYIFMSMWKQFGRFPPVVTEYYFTLE